jgi:hypothetical protein
MGALTIAFDITIVGALALPWVLLVIHLFFFEGENLLEDALQWVKDKEQQAAVGVLLFAMTYTLGSAVSRTAHDFFNDDDLRLQVDGQLLRVGVTENRIVARAYCEASGDNLLPAATDNPAIADKINTFQKQKTDPSCRRALRWTEHHTYVKTDDDLIDTAHDLFSLQENSLLLRGEDSTLRLRQLHDQIMVLRGAGFNGFIGFSLCLFAWGATLRREHRRPEHRRSWLRLPLLAAPAVYLAVALIATVNHFRERAPSDPPYMEFTLMLLALVGVWLVWKPPAPPKQADANQSHPNQSQVNQDHANQSQANQAAATQGPANQAPVQKSGAGKNVEKKCYWQNEQWGRLVLLAAVLTTAAVLGWWSTELLYAEQVVYSYSQTHPSQGAAAPQK